MSDHTNAKLAASVFDVKTIYATINTLTTRKNPIFVNSVEKVFARVEPSKCIDVFIRSSILSTVQFVIKGSRNEVTPICIKKRV